MVTVQLTGNNVQKFLDVAVDKFNIQIKIIDDIKRPSLSKRKKGKWAKVTDKIRWKMSKTTSDYLNECSNEIRNWFELRDFSTNKNNNND